MIPFDFLPGAPPDPPADGVGDGVPVVPAEPILCPLWNSGEDCVVVEGVGVGSAEPPPLLSTDESTLGSDVVVLLPSLEVTFAHIFSRNVAHLPSNPSFLNNSSLISNDAASPADSIFFAFAAFCAFSAAFFFSS